jgi:hypothetical protein
MAMGYGLNGLDSIPGTQDFSFLQCVDLNWDPPSLLSSGYRE